MSDARADERRPTNDEPHRVVIDDDSPERGYRISGMPEHLRWATLDYAEEMAATYESQRLADIANRGENPPTPEPTPEVVYIDHATAKAALTAASYEDDPLGDDSPRQRIHTFAGQGISIGCDWDLTDALTFVDNAYVGDDERPRIAWVDDPFGHDLIVIGSDTPDGDRQQISFQVEAPEGTFR